MQYKLLKDLPGWRAGTIFSIQLIENIIGMVATSVMVNGEYLSDSDTEMILRAFNHISDRGIVTVDSEWFIPLGQGKQIVPITMNFDKKPIGFMEIDSPIPLDESYVFSIGGMRDEKGIFYVHEVSLIKKESI